MRYPAVAGQFYSRTENALVEEIDSCYRSPIGPGKLPSLRKGNRSIRGLVVPHAGYVFSGPVAAHAYYALAQDGFPQTFVVIGPNHSGMGSPVALTTQDFLTPLGEVRVNKELAEELMGKGIPDDILAHRYEHSIEVQLPFLQHISKDFDFVPICMMDQEYRTAKELGELLRAVIGGKDVVIIASTDFSHYVPQSIAHTKDNEVIQMILGLDPQGMNKVRIKQNVSMCGYGPVMATLIAANGRQAELLKYATSGDVRPMPEVVGYGAVVIRT
ncbi:MAG: AmmeMemoRadiSam system protein B [Thermoplasmata archaeon]